MWAFAFVQPKSELCMDMFQVGQAEQRQAMRLLLEEANNDKGACGKLLKLYLLLSRLGVLFNEYFLK